CTRTFRPDRQTSCASVSPNQPLSEENHDQASTHKGFFSKLLVLPLIGAVAGVLAIFLIGQLVPAAVGGSHGLITRYFDTNINVLTNGDPGQGWDTERWTSLVGGARMFLAHPIFGAGLGAFVLSFAREHGTFTIIHSTPLWLLAETGLVGFAVFAAAYLYVLRREIRGSIENSTDAAGILLVLSLLAFGLMAQVHDLMYQRVFWLLVGAALFSGPRPQPQVDVSTRQSRAGAELSRHDANVDYPTVRDFGREWQRFDQRDVSGPEMDRSFGEYFAAFPWESLPAGAQGFDAGCGSGRWAALVAPRVGHLHCVDASAVALRVARNRLATFGNCSLHEASLDAMPLADASMDFGYSLGVLHHLPDPAAGLAACVRKLKPGAPMLIYIYYAFDNRPGWFGLLWRASDLLCRTVSRAPFGVKAAFAEIVAALIYWPLARSARLFERCGADVENWPLGTYRWRSFYTMRTDALDRLGAWLEHRMTAAQIEAMMKRAGLTDIRFSPSVPFWCAVGRRTGRREDA
ncbi:MAG: methyltransferase domain-containing protein, partial [Stellaceae bacterium]